MIFCSTVECLTCVCSLGKRVKLFTLEWRSRKRRFLLCLMTIFDFPHSNLFWLHAGAIVMANRSVGRILRKGQKFPWEVKIQNHSRNEHLSPFISHRAAGVYPMFTGWTVTYSFLWLSSLVSDGGNKTGTKLEIRGQKKLTPELIKKSMIYFNKKKQILNPINSFLN